jgi:hypothetical protein
MRIVCVLLADTRVCVFGMGLQMCDENPYSYPDHDEAQWFTGGHLGTQIQTVNWQVSTEGLPEMPFGGASFVVCMIG